MIKFADEEAKIFLAIKNYALSLDPIVTPRLAGGFVRDKIMGIQSNDIDITLDNISGYNFAQGLSKFTLNSSGIHKILANPDKSKHLETAVANICGFNIDFVHLRNETYADSRIPNIKPGTPEEDAYRRDITINSIFYNLITDEIEDFTGRGIADISKKVLDTPLDPKTTLFDDPLRILRIFRFKSKFGFDISPRIYESLKDLRVRLAIKEKVSNERIGIEIFKMLKYKNGHLGLLEIVDCELVNYIFKPFKDIHIEKKKAKSFFANYTFIVSVLDKFNRDLQINHEIILLYIILQYYMNIKQTFKKKEVYLNAIITKENLKANKMLFSAVDKIENSIYYLKQLERYDLEEIVVECGKYLLESLIILYSSTKESRYMDMTIECLNKHYENAYLTKPIIDGDFLLEKNQPVANFRIILKKALVNQLKFPNLSKDELYDLII